jgi:hypothetical protein
MAVLFAGCGGLEGTEGEAGEASELATTSAAVSVGNGGWGWCPFPWYLGGVYSHITYVDLTKDEVCLLLSGMKAAEVLAPLAVSNPTALAAVEVGLSLHRDWFANNLGMNGERQFICDLFGGPIYKVQRNGTATSCGSSGGGTPPPCEQCCDWRVDGTCARCISGSQVCP